MRLLDTGTLPCLCTIHASLELTAQTALWIVTRPGWTVAAVVPPVPVNFPEIPVLLSVTAAHSSVVQGIALNAGFHYVFVCGVTGQLELKFS